MLCFCCFFSEAEISPNEFLDAARRGTLRDLETVKKYCTQNKKNTLKLNVGVKSGGPLHQAVTSKNLALLEYLLEIKEINLLATNERGNTVLHLAIERDWDEIVSKLIEKQPMLVNFRNGFGDTAECLAERLGKKEVAKIIKEAPHLSKAPAKLRN